MSEVLSIKQLHEATGKLVRIAGKARTPTLITDRGQLVAVLGSPESLAAPERKPRRTLPEYEALMRQPVNTPVLEDLDAVRDGR